MDLDVSESVDRCRQFQRLIPDSEILSLSSICKLLRLPQKTIATALYMFYAAKHSLLLEPDDLILYAACVSLSCRTCETHRPVEKILSLSALSCSVEVSPDTRPLYIDCVNKTEVSVCVCLDFELEPPDYYGLLHRLCRENSLSTEYSRHGWVFINDILTSPLIIFFTVPEVVLGGLLLEYSVRTEREDEPGMIATDEQLAREFLRFMGIADTNEQAVLYVALELMRRYEEKMGRRPAV